MQHPSLDSWRQPWWGPDVIVAVYFNANLSVVASCCPCGRSLLAVFLPERAPVLPRNVGSNLPKGGVNNGVCVWCQPGAEDWYQPNPGAAGSSFNTTCEDNFRGLALQSFLLLEKDSLSACYQLACSPDPLKPFGVYLFESWYLLPHTPTNATTTCVNILQFPSKMGIKRPVS